MRWLLIACMAGLAVGVSEASPAADGTLSHKLAEGLANVLATERLCGHHVDQQGLQAFIRRVATTEDPDFETILTLAGRKAEHTAALLRDEKADRLLPVCLQLQRLGRNMGVLH